MDLSSARMTRNADGLPSMQHDFVEDCLASVKEATTSWALRIHCNMKVPSTGLRSRQLTARLRAQAVIQVLLVHSQRYDGACTHIRESGVPRGDRVWLADGVCLTCGDLTRKSTRLPSLAMLSHGLCRTVCWASALRSEHHPGRS